MLPQYLLCPCVHSLYFWEVWLLGTILENSGPFLVSIEASYGAHDGNLRLNIYLALSSTRQRFSLRFSFFQAQSDGSQFS